jgi:tetratricopeptide (TPR) repeat protein
MSHLSLLAYDDCSVQSTLHISYQALSDDEQQAFAALGLFQHHDFDTDWSAAVTARDDIQTILRRLYSLSLVQHVQGTRYKLHPLFAAFARDRQNNIEELPDTEQTASPIKALHSKLWMNYGVVRGQQGDYTAEAEAYGISLQLAEQIEHQEMLAMLHSNLAELAATQGNLNEAIEHIQRTLEIAQASGDRENIAVAFIAPGDYAMQQNDMETAQLHLLNGLNEARRISSLHLALRARLKLGEWHLQQNDLNAAKQAFDIVKRHTVERPDDDAAALYGLARVALAQNDRDNARQQAKQSLTIYERTGSAQADEIRAWLNNISD